MKCCVDFTAELVSDSVLCFYLPGGESHCFYLQTVWSFTLTLPSLIKQQSSLPLIAGSLWTLPAERWLIAALVVFFLVGESVSLTVWHLLLKRPQSPPTSRRCLLVQATNCYPYGHMIISGNSLLVTVVIVIRSVPSQCCILTFNTMPIFQP